LTGELFSHKESYIFVPSLLRLTASILLHAKLTKDSMEQFIAAHPSLSEAIHEAILCAVGHAVHV
jgi:hypothetical protein